MPNAPSTPSQSQAQYRLSIPVGAEKRNHCHIYLDEQLYISALTLLADIVTSGASHPQLDTPAFAPVPFHIEIVSTLLVHPKYTTQAPQGDGVELAWRAIAFLRSLLATLGPLNANLSEAFSLAPLRSRGARRGRNAGDDGGSDSDNDDDERMEGVVANEGRIRRCAKDFWHIVGWAFNCSVVYPKRWKYWKVWLGYMLDVLEADWEQRETLDKEGGVEKPASTQDSGLDLPMLQESLLVKYLAEVKGRPYGMKRVVGAVFAAGSTDDLRAYPEVFPNETRAASAQNGQKRKREDSIKTTFVSFNDADIEDFAFDSSQPEPGLDSSQNSIEDEIASDPWISYPETVSFRQRILAMLSQVSATFPDTFIEFRELYEIYCVNAKTLPLPAFTLLFSPSALSTLPAIVLVSFSRLVLARLSPSAPVERNAEGISQEILERSVLRCTAATSSTADNARVSILVENLFRLYLKSCMACHTPELVAAVEAGVQARESKAKIDRRRKDSTADEKDREWLEASGQRLKRLVQWVGSFEPTKGEGRQH